VAVVSTAGVYDFEPKSGRMRIKTLHPGVSADLAQLASGFELLRPEGEIPVTEVPSPEILEILRNEVDPQGFFISMPGA
jgi:glutaconate CoA-transferase subunit B